LISQSRDWACDIIGNCPDKRGRFYILRKGQSYNQQGGVWLRTNVRKEDEHITSDVGWKSGISSRKRGCAGTLRIWP
jgi:hypothetical protein